MVQQSYSAPSAWNSQFRQDSPRLLTPTQKQVDRYDLDRMTPSKIDLLPSLVEKLELPAEKDDYEDQLENERQIARRRSENLEQLTVMTDPGDNYRDNREEFVPEDDYEAMLEQERQIAQSRSEKVDREMEREDVQTIDLSEFSARNYPGTSDELLAMRAKSHRDYKDWTSRNQTREGSMAFEAADYSSPPPMQSRRQESPRPMQSQESVPLGSSLAFSVGVNDYQGGSATFQSVAGPSPLGSYGMPGSYTPMQSGYFPQSVSQNVVSSPSLASFAGFPSQSCRPQTMPMQQMGGSITMPVQQMGGSITMPVQQMGGSITMPVQQMGGSITMPVGSQAGLMMPPTVVASPSMMMPPPTYGGSIQTPAYGGSFQSVQYSPSYSPTTNPIYGMGPMATTPTTYGMAPGGDSV